MMGHYFLVTGWRGIELWTIFEYTCIVLSALDRNLVIRKTPVHVARMGEPPLLISRRR